MGTEIERKFLVRNDTWKTSNSTLFRQGYLTIDPNRTVRVRLAGNKGYLTLKGLNRGPFVWNMNIPLLYRMPGKYWINCGITP